MSDKSYVIDPVELSCELINCPSVTPVDAGVMDVAIKYLQQLGFSCHKLYFGEGEEKVGNIFASITKGEGKHLCLAGHLDVVPCGDESMWTYHPFCATVVNEKLYGRGAADMKTGIAALISACGQFLQTDFNGTISFLITLDEEGPAINGTAKVLKWMAEQNINIDASIVAEPSSPKFFGQYYKIGRRGSMTGYITVNGKQGHIAYPENFDNSITTLTKFLYELNNLSLDTGNEFFPPSNLEVVNIEVNNKAENVVPAKATATFNIRYNTEHSLASLQEKILNLASKVSKNISIGFKNSGDPFLADKNSDIVAAVAKGAQRIINKTVVADTSGGTSDARFIKDYCNVVEFGIVGATNHQVNEHVLIKDIYTLTDCYIAIFKEYFQKIGA